MTRQDYLDAIYETAKQENLFRLANDREMAAWWICERVRLRALLFDLIQKEARQWNTSA